MSGFVFPAETFAFLAGIAAHNEKTWFDANRALYDKGYVEAGKAFVAELGPRLRATSPGVQFDPRVNGSIGRVNRDIRFSKDKRPYKDHLGLWFWHGDKKGRQQPGFWFGLTGRSVQLGVGLYGFDKPMLDDYRQSVLHPRSGKALLAAVTAVTSNGPYQIEGKTRKRLPKGFITDPDRLDYLLHEGLYTSIDLPVEVAREPGFTDLCLEHYANTWPIAKWLLDEGIGQ
ncbi:MAG: DUF2461 domain-containing protein [Devosia sp.]|nr:DUF2461 domain-containing protein [Devosia sp.]